MTPMLQQYFEQKKKYPKEILFFRMGDFYEMFGEDAMIAAKILNIALTARNKGTENEIPMCGLPYHAIDNYLCKLTRAGKSVAICEQMGDPKLPGLVKRDVIRVVTPGTTFDDNVLNSNENNYIVAIKEFKDKGKLVYGLALADITTGEFKLAEFIDFETLRNEIFKIYPSEIIINNELVSKPEMNDILQEFTYTLYDPIVTQSASENLCEHFQVNSLSGFGVADFKTGIMAAGYLFSYLQDTQKVNLAHINNISLYNFADYMLLDSTTIRNLELLHTAWDGSYQGSLLWVLDNTSTPMGGRLLRRWLLRPLRSKEKIEQRLQAVEYFFTNPDILSELKTDFKQISDIERLVAKIGCQRANARDLITLKNSIIAIPVIKEKVKDTAVDLLVKVKDSLNEHPKVLEIINNGILPEPSLGITDGGIIADGYNEQVDELRKIMNTGKDFIKQIQEKERERSGISNLKIKFNKVFGYYIEISKGNINKVPEDYIRKQTLVNAERFITPELKEYEEKVLGAEDKIKKLEFDLFNEIREQIAGHLVELQQTAGALAQLDCLSGLAYVALENNYSKPNIIDGSELTIKDGRHPVIEKIQAAGSYIPNDATFSKEEQFLLITGPNMSGKSSFLRQTALITLMAHLGSFVSAKEASISIVDRIFTRVGASDNLGKGESTFMVEMQEAGIIINNATEHSLIILDELGRGTSTYDGLSIAWAITEFIHDKIKAKTMFATHYHELIDVIDKKDNAKNYCVAAKEENDKVVFLHKVVAGGVSRSYGVEVAKLAGLPQDIILRAMDILQFLESDDWQQAKQGQKALPLMTTPRREHPVIGELKQIKIDELTPIEALNKLAEIVEKV